jgi:hypothetical protein
VDNPEIDTETANRTLVARDGLEHALRLLDEHAASCTCPNPAAHILRTPTLRVIEGGKTA